MCEICCITINYMRASAAPLTLGQAPELIGQVVPVRTPTSDSAVSLCLTKNWS